MDERGKIDRVLSGLRHSHFIWWMGMDGWEERGRWVGD